MVTKYDIGDSVYYLHQGEMGKGVIDSIRIIRERSAITGADWGVNVYYQLVGKQYWNYGEKEENIFLTLQDAVISFEKVKKEYLEERVKELEKRKKPKKKKLKDLIFSKRK